MPVTGDYGSLLYLRRDDGFEINPLGELKKFEALELLEKVLPRKEQARQEEPEGVHLVYYTGKPFQAVVYHLYELGDEDAEQVKKEAALGKVLKNIPEHHPQILPLTIRFGKKDERWFHVLEDGKTLFSDGKYYSNPVLAERIFAIARVYCDFQRFDTSSFRGLAKAKYSFRTNTRTLERVTEDKAILTKLERGLQVAQYDMGEAVRFLTEC